MAMIIFIEGVRGIVIGFAGYLFREVRDVEGIMPDQEVAKASEEGEDGKGSLEGATRLYQRISI